MAVFAHPFPAVADPVVTLTPDVDPLEGNATDNITLTCSWNSTVFYLVWFKDGAPPVQHGPCQGRHSGQH